MAIGTLAPPMDAAAGLAHVAERSRVWRKFVRNPAAIAGGLILLIVIGAAIFAPYVAPHEHTRQSLIRRLTPPVWAEGGKATYLLGTDQVGRDILSRMITRPRLADRRDLGGPGQPDRGGHPGAHERLPAGTVDTAIMTVVDVMLSFPQLLLALAFVAALGPSMLTIIIVLGLTGWSATPGCGRRCSPCGRGLHRGRPRHRGEPLRTRLRHLLPIPSRPYRAVHAAVAQAILQEAACPSWGWGREAPIDMGHMIALGRLRERGLVVPHLPGLAILLTVLAITWWGPAARRPDPRVT